MPAENLIKDRQPISLRIEVSLVHELLQALSVVMMSSDWEGFEPWVYEAAARLDDDLRMHMEAIHAVLWNHRVLERLAPGYDLTRGFSSFVEAAEDAPPDDYHMMLECPLRLLSRSAAAGCTHRTRADSLVSYLQRQGVSLPERTMPRVLRILDDAEEMKASFLRVIKGFWVSHFEARYIECLPTLSASVSVMRNRQLPLDFEGLFSMITGGLVPWRVAVPDPSTEIILIPSCHLGPYVAWAPLAKPWPAVAISYNARRLGAENEQPLSRPENVVALLKAVAEETRYRILQLLDGTELCGTEITDRLATGQSDVSRHLRLLVAEGLLCVRYDGATRYYSANDERLQSLAQALLSPRAASHGSSSLPSAENSASTRIPLP